ncbi:probable protein SGE1 [Zygosaccharomyces bailii]|nr:probable protein SGE1 [Zygosaccharomyces bailii]
MKGVSFFLCLLCLCVTLFLAALDIVICVTLYDTVGIKFNDFANVGWLITGYSLANAIATLLWGRLAAMIGLKSSLMYSIVIFEAGSLISALSSSMNMLIAGRIISGLGGSGIESLVFVIGTSIVSPKYRGIIITVLSVSYVIAEGVGPFLGGVFTETISWRWCFYINLPIGMLAFLILTFTHNSDEQISGFVKCRAVLNNIWNWNYSKLLTGDHWESVCKMLFFQLDIFGVLLSSTGFTLLMLALSFGGTTFPWTSGSLITLFILGPLLVLLFCVYDFHFLPWFSKQVRQMHAKPLLSWNIASNWGIISSSVAGLFSCFAYSLQSVFLVQYYQLVHNKGPTLASVHLWEFSIPASISAIIMGCLNASCGIIKPFMIFGVVCGVVGSGLLCLLTGYSTLSESIGYCILPGVAFGCILQASMLSSQVQIPQDDFEYDHKFIEVTAFNAFAHAIGFSFGGNMGTMIFVTSVNNRLKNSNLHLPSFSTIDALISYRSSNYDGNNSPLAKVFTSSVQDVFYCALGCYALAFIFGMFTSSKKIEVSTKEE